MAKFEIAIFNQQVVDALAAGKRHRNLNDSWADTHYIDVDAADADGARRKIAARHPQENGFVIVSVEPKNEDAI
jgi:hypothetical protein